jgi:hypothetical protein
MLPEILPVSLAVGTFHHIKLPLVFAIISIAQQARPNVIGQIAGLRAN